MNTFVKFTVSFTAWDFVTKMVRLYLGNTETTMGTLLCEAVICVVFLVWGVLVLAVNT